MLMNLLIVILSIFELIDKTVFIIIFCFCHIYFKHLVKQNHCNFDFFQNTFIADTIMPVQIDFFHSIHFS